MPKDLKNTPHPMETFENFWYRNRMMKEADELLMAHPVVVNPMARLVRDQDESCDETTTFPNERQKVTYHG